MGNPNKSKVRDTSREAYHEQHVTGRTDNIKAGILAALAAFGRPASTKEMACAIGTTPSSITAARGELHNEGHIVCSGTGPCGVTGRTVRLYRLPGEGEHPHPREVITGTPSPTGTPSATLDLFGGLDPEDEVSNGGSWSSEGY